MKEYYFFGLNFYFGGVSLASLGSACYGLRCLLRCCAPGFARPSHASRTPLRCKPKELLNIF